MGVLINQIMLVRVRRCNMQRFGLRSTRSDCRLAIHTTLSQRNYLFQLHEPHGA
jgi:hypothetical protein